MSSGVNKVIIIGNTGQDPEIRFAQSGSKVASLSVGVSEYWKNKQTGERQQRTEWVRVVSFSPGLSDVIERYVKKGSKLYIEGKLQTRKWQDQSGNDRYSTEVVLDGFGSTLTMLDGKSEQNSGGDEYNQDSKYSAGNQADDLDDGIPF